LQFLCSSNCQPWVTAISAAFFARLLFDEAFAQTYSFADVKCDDVAKCSTPIFSRVAGYFAVIVRVVARGGTSGARPPRLKSVPPHFTFGPPVAAYIQYCILKMWPPLLVFAPPAVTSWRRSWLLYEVLRRCVDFCDFFWAANLKHC